MRAFSLAGCCCNCDDRCPDDGYCTACGETADEAATYEVVLSGFGSVDLTGCSGWGAVCDLSVINGTYSVPYVSAGSVCLSNGCRYYLEYNLGVNAFACNPTDLDHHVTITLELGYSKVSECVCGSCAFMAIGIDCGTPSGLDWHFYNVDIDATRVIPCGDTVTFTDLLGVSFCNSFGISGTAAATKL